MFSSSGGYSKRDKAKAYPKQKAYYNVELTRNIVLINIKMILKKMAYQKIQIKIEKFENKGKFFKQNEKES